MNITCTSLLHWNAMLVDDIRLIYVEDLNVV